MSNTNSSFNAEEYPSLDVSYQKINEMLGHQLDQIDAIDSKIGVMLGLEGVVLSVLLSSKIVGFVSILSDPRWLDFLYYGAVILIFGSLALNIFAHKAQNYRGGPKPKNIINNYIKVTPDKVKVRMAKEMALSYKINKKLVDEKLNKFNWSFWFLFGGLGLMAVHLGYTIFIRWC